MPKAYIGLGSNQGDQLLNLKRAVKLIHKDSKIKIEKIASVYKTEPVGYEDQPWFYNSVLKMDTSYEPEELLDKLLEIEQELGRVRVIRWGPRTVDLDLLLYENQIIESERLSVPHPRMTERDFVLIPLLEIEPNLVVRGVPLAELIEENPGPKKVIFIGEKLC